MKEKFLPIGTVVLLKGGEKTLMITSYLIFANGQDGKKKMFDYGACAFPEGIIESNYAVGFNHDQISEIVHMGLENDIQKSLNALLNETYDKVRAEFEKNNN